MRYSFLILPAYGHVNPTLAIAQELVAHGQEVIYYLPEAFREAVEATGAAIRSYESRLLKGIGKVPSQRGEVMREEMRQVLPQIMDRIRADKPDVILHDPMVLWSRIVIQLLQVPAISLRPTYAMNEHFNMASMLESRPNHHLPGMKEVVEKTNEVLAEICASYHVPPVSFMEEMMYAEPLNIVFLPKAFQPEAQTFDERFLFVGPSIAPRRQASDFPLDQLNYDRPLLYVSLGTIFNTESAFYKQCFEAFGESDYQVVLSHGKHIDLSALGPIPENFLLSSYVPQLEILERAKVFVTHSGMNSTMESLYYGVPMVAIPQMVEQEMTAQRIAEMGLGLALEKDAVTSAGLRAAVERVANDVTIHERVQQIKQYTRESGGYKLAAEAIMQFAWQSR
ncbi:glycosyl transferase [Ktedonosporobacter rubrisoli]|uniref:Glycosyl transferase n=1 Tax=Ktedonosporobacter rubrisoli TaxID=2509675 RepID=A0A4P6JHV6_KTERU|nr:macrolide family glycosyltransferase [Ktedonosporobacter rubrisoli]QBD74628.1 glycosyl transferase [Ktedonosporobacter rubrisoli]